MEQQKNVTFGVFKLSTYTYIKRIGRVLPPVDAFWFKPNFFTDQWN